MPKINGFELLELLEETPQIIFSTAYDQYAIKAFENNAADYLLKPYTKERFDQAILRVKQRLSQKKVHHLILEKLLRTLFMIHLVE